MTLASVWVTSTLCSNCNTSAYDITSSTTASILEVPLEPDALPHLTMVGQPVFDSLYLSSLGLPQFLFNALTFQQGFDDADLGGVLGLSPYYALVDDPEYPGQNFLH
mmetsp:Transcript_11406/g.8364  ORF Transcript_11406/g.8364 Transcript_11406/m.8364 type:complete len:107 (+) Transcript_11406:153-473(+)|eukprot:CAMPEP_0202979752 /NCGR_PEP_ID=MMETSP1396-20130829/85826_1 /ASSEMBLY_ACC=CAM_ASM_000872 /TAXON_ID= /ORGANISM="Pseudokeronopsis sp., Strain Brazil" /LENGTH=106 /DNA_ID=CAMNT_0049719337 /DNA_START=79 /DNA_END=399 /DNA_ORIENTATION=+